MIQIITLIPINYNDGRKIPIQEYRDFEDKLLEIAGGFSIDGITAGSWMDNNELYRDKSRKYIIAVEKQSQVKQIKQVIIQTGKKLGQLAMYFEVKVDSKIEFIEIK